jgi:hypothetical protein
MIPRREGDDAPLPFLGRKLEQAVGRAPQLECAARLQTLAFEPDSSAADLVLDERRSLNQALYSFGGFDDVSAGDPKRFF